MTGEREDGGPAFPIPIQFCPDGKDGVVVDSIEYAPRNGGMSLRDWFAGQAFPVAWKAFEMGYFQGDIDIAKCAYQFADAMLAARKGNTP
jgi:hypothetical protein